MNALRQRDASFWRSALRMHEWPLILFTTLAIPAAGWFAARLFAGALPDVAAGPRIDRAAAALLAIGLAASLAHLGKLPGAPLALWRVGRSQLSNEAALASALLAAALLTAAPWFAPAFRESFGRLAGVLALGLLATLGLVYFLAARWPWRTAIAASPLICGLAIGVMWLESAGVRPSAELAPLALLLLDALVFCGAYRPALSERRGSSFDRAAPVGPPYDPTRPRRRRLPVYSAVFAKRRLLVVFRLLLVDLVPAGFLLARTPAFALASALAGVFVDRFTFYGAAAACSTEGEMAGVEALIARRAPEP